MRPSASAKVHAAVLLFFWLVIFGISLASPPLLDDADATHAQAAQAMLRTGDWVTLHVNGVRYLEKAPLPYWIAALSLRLFGENAFAIHFPLALAVLGLAALGYHWARRSFDTQTAFYTALFVLTSTGAFLFTRIFIPEALLSLLLACGLYALDRTLEPDPHTSHAPEELGAPVLHSRLRKVQSQISPWTFWFTMALAVLTKGLIAIVFLLGTAALYLTLTRAWSRWRELRPFTGTLLFLAVAAPWHILAGFRNTGGANGHGFFWFYFVNEHFLRFVGRRIPQDYNKLPALLYWPLHFVWLFPWSFFVPAAMVLLWRKRFSFFSARTNAQRTSLLLASFSSLVLVFFSLSTNQEYYTFPVYLPVLMLLAAALTRALQVPGAVSLQRTVHSGFIALAFAGWLAALALAYGLWSARRLPFVPDIGTVLGHRGVGSYTLSMSHFFDLTGESFAALRLPAALALCILATGPALAWLLHRKRHETQAILTIAATSAIFLVAAHLALVRFAPVLSSYSFAETILEMERSHHLDINTPVLLYGDQSYGSSIPFYLQHTVQLVDGRTSSMLFGSTFPDVPPVFVSSADLAATWGHGPRKLLFLPAEERDAADRLFGSTAVVLYQSSGKELLTDRPLAPLLPATSTAAPPPSALSTGMKRSGETAVFAPAHTR